MALTVQRLRLRIVGNPIKLDATILEMDADGRRLKVRFDGPLDDTVLYRWSDLQLVDQDCRPNSEVGGRKDVTNDARFFEVLMANKRAKLRGRAMSQQLQQHRRAVNTAGYAAASRGQTETDVPRISKPDRDAWLAGWKRYHREAKAHTLESPDIAKSARPGESTKFEAVLHGSEGRGTSQAAPPPLGDFDVTQRVTRSQVANLLCSAFEGGSNYWYEITKFIEPPKRVWSSDVASCCDGDGHITYTAFGTCAINYTWYSPIDTPLNPGGALIIVSLEIDGAKSWRLDEAAIVKGLGIMAKDHPRHFGYVTSENADATTGDVFLQCCLFGKVIYG